MTFSELLRAILGLDHSSAKVHILLIGKKRLPELEQTIFYMYSNCYALVLSPMPVFAHCLIPPFICTRASLFNCLAFFVGNYVERTECHLGHCMQGLYVHMYCTKWQSSPCGENSVVSGQVVPALRCQLAEQGCVDSQMQIARELLIQVLLLRLKIFSDSAQRLV
jgi:hypothetical protein